MIRLVIAIVIIIIVSSTQRCTLRSSTRCDCVIRRLLHPIRRTACSTKSGYHTYSSTCARLRQARVKSIARRGEVKSKTPEGVFNVFVIHGFHGFQTALLSFHRLPLSPPGSSTLVSFMYGFTIISTTYVSNKHKTSRIVQLHM